MRRVSYLTWHYCVSYRQETICEGFPVRHGTTVFLVDRKLFAKGFLFGMTLLCFIATGNYLRRVSWSTWHYCISCRQETNSPGDFSTPLEMTWEAWQHCVSCQQETVRERFPIRLDAIVFLTGRKLFAKGFLVVMALLCFLPAGNCLRIVSYSTWHYCVSYRQETICEGFPGRHGTTVFLADRKLFAKGFLVVMAPLCFLPAGNYLRRVSWST